MFSQLGIIKKIHINRAFLGKAYVLYYVKTRRNARECAFFSRTGHKNAPEAAVTVTSGASLCRIS
jgi:hypothetical protein